MKSPRFSMRTVLGAETFDSTSCVSAPAGLRNCSDARPLPWTATSTAAEFPSRVWRIMSTALRWGFPPLPRKAISAVRTTSPETFFQTNWKSSMPTHIFSPLPLIVYVRLAASYCAEPAWRTAPTSWRPSKMPSCWDWGCWVWAFRARAASAKAAKTANLPMEEKERADINNLLKLQCDFCWCNWWKRRIGVAFWDGLRRFSNLCGLSGIVHGGFYFHPSDKGLSLGTPEREKPLGSSGFSL